MSQSELIRKAEKTREAAKALALYRLAIDQTGIISTAVRRQLLLMVSDSLPATKRRRAGS